MALAEFRALLLDLDRPLELARDGRIDLGVSKVPGELSAVLEAEAVTINGQRFVRGPVLASLPDVTSLQQAENERFRIRGEGFDAVEEYLALGEAVFPYLESDVGGRPTRRLNVLILATRPV